MIDLAGICAVVNTRIVDFLLIKLIYFNFRGRGELIRLVFHATDTDFVDQRVEFSDWPGLKPTIPGGRLPSLQVTKPDGTVEHYEESMAIARWIARKHNLMGTTDEEYYKIERIISQCADVDKEFIKVFIAPPAEREKVQMEIMKSTVPRVLDIICDSIKNSGSKFVAGSQPTLGDLCLMTSTDQVMKADPTLIRDKYKQLISIRDHVLDHFPKLREYLNSRSETPF
ncbi:Glutathione S-transferase [Fasciola hepatica]|uniref:Glutathione S-transferase n=1 Tax=Fasciola hepatica TaxID=6192 RepID=A0A2H1C7S5_FASHE|nr:Glutathione S-transferase [Fasciola hepatica]